MHVCACVGVLAGVAEASSLVVGMNVTLLPSAWVKEASVDPNPFSRSTCSRYYWKVIAVGYLAVCVLLAIIYVAIYAEQHGLYGSYYDNLENLGRPLTSQTESVSCSCVFCNSWHGIRGETAGSLPFLSLLTHMLMKGTVFLLRSSVVVLCCTQWCHYRDECTYNMKS